MTMAEPAHRSADPEEVTVVASILRDLFDAAYHHGTDSPEYLGLLARCGAEFDPIHVLDALLTIIAEQYQTFPTPIAGDHPATVLLRTVGQYVTTHPLSTPEAP